MSTGSVRTSTSCGTGRVVTNNAASTQPPRELLELYRRLVPGYENVHRGQSTASRRTTELFEASYDTIAGWLNAPSRRSIVHLPQHHRGDQRGDVLAADRVPRRRQRGHHDAGAQLQLRALVRRCAARSCRGSGGGCECRLARFDPVTGELDLEHLASLVDSRTKLVCCTGASNFLGTKPPLAAIRAIADASGYPQPGGERRSLLLVDGAQLVPSSRRRRAGPGRGLPGVLLPQAAGAVRGRRAVRQGAPAARASLPFLYGGDMIAEGQVTPGPRRLQRRCRGSTPPAPRTSSGVIVSAQALRLLVDLGRRAAERRLLPAPPTPLPAGSRRRRPWPRVGAHTRGTRPPARIDGLRRDRRADHLRPQRPAPPRTPLVAFNVAGHRTRSTWPRRSNEHGVESRAGCHCATLAHQRPRARPARQLPAQLLPLQHHRRRRPGHQRPTDVAAS